MFTPYCPWNVSFLLGLQFVTQYIDEYGIQSPIFLFINFNHMRKQLNLLLLLLGLFACRQNTADKNTPATPLPHPDQATIANTVHDFYEWYDAFVKDSTRNLNFLDRKGKFARLDRARVDQYFDQLKAGGYISDEYIALEKDFLRKCEPLWQTEDKNEALTGLDYDRVFCAQDWDPDFWTKAPVRVEDMEAGRVKATLAGTEAGTPREHTLELKQEAGKWLIAKIHCDDSEAEDYSGAYKTNDEACPVELTITLKDGSYLYGYKAGKRKQNGRVEVKQTDSITYLTFKGLLAVRPKKEIEAQYAEEKITIQNYGNSMNEYLKFKDCDLKYIELEKYAESVVPAAAQPSGETAPKQGNTSPASTTKPKLSAVKTTTPRSPLPVVSVNRKGDITLSGKKTTYETLKKDLQQALLAQSVIPDRLSVKSVGEVGMGTRQEIQTLVNEAIAGAKWVRKKAAIEALNTPVSKKLALPTQLVVNRYRTSGQYALLDARPLQINGRPVDYEMTVYRDEFRTRKFADRVIGLLKYEKGAWKVQIYTIGLDEVAAATWRKKYGAPAGLFGQ